MLALAKIVVCVASLLNVEAPTHPDGSVIVPNVVSAGSHHAFDGLALPKSNTIYLYNLPNARSDITLAHEIGHILLRANGMNYHHELTTTRHRNGGLLRNLTGEVNMKLRNVDRNFRQSCDVLTALRVLDNLPLRRTVTRVTIR